MKFLLAATTLLLVSFLNTYGKAYNQIQPDTTIALLNSGSKAIAIAGINSGGQPNSQIINNLTNVTVPGSYFQINLSETELSSINLNHIKSATISSRAENRLQNWLNNNKTGQAILEQWFERQPDGSFSTEFLEKSRLLDESLAERLMEGREFNKETATYFANSPLNETFLMVFDFRNVQTMDDYYDGINTHSRDRILRGYISSVYTYIFKFDFNRSVAEKFLDDYFTINDDASAQAKQEAFEKSEFPFFFVTMREDEIASVQPRANQEIAPEEIKSDKELLDALAQLAVNNITDLIDEDEISLSASRVIKNIKPITAGIGAKENIRFDQRFGVYENRIAFNGKVKPKRISVVKSMKIADNTTNKSHDRDYSTFYKIAGGKVAKNKMFLKKKYDAGINLFAGNTIKGLSGTTGRFEYYFSKAMGGAVVPGKKAKGLTSVKLYFEAAQKKKSYQLFNQSENFTFTRGSIGIEKEYRPLPFMHWGPFVGYGLEYTTWENSGDLFSSNFVEFGARLGINLRHNVQVIGSATNYHLIKTVWMDENRDVVEPDFNYSGTFTDRAGFGYSIGLRIML